jgi:hypothetical protein
VTDIYLPEGFYLPMIEKAQLNDGEWVIHIYDSALMNLPKYRHGNLLPTRAFTICKEMHFGSGDYVYKGVLRVGDVWTHFADLETAINVLCARYRILK